MKKGGQTSGGAGGGEESADGSDAAGLPSFSLLRMSEETIQKFSGTDKVYSASRWAQEIEDTADIYGWSPLQKLLVARRSLISTAALWLKTEKPFKTYDELKAALVKEFPDSVSVKEIHELMAARKKKKEESCYEYMCIMKELGKRGKLPDYVAIQYILDGIIDYEPNKMILYGVTTYPDLKEKLKIYETIKNNTKRPEKKEEKPKTSCPPVMKTKATFCFNCGDKNHLAISCPNKARGQKCFKCNDFGHIAANCKNETQTPPTPKLKQITMWASNETAPPIINEDATNESERMTARDVNKCDGEMKRSLKKIMFGKREVTCLIDTGSDMNLITCDCVVLCGYTKWDMGKNVQISGLCNKTVDTLGRLSTEIVIDGRCFKTNFYIVPSDCIPYPVIIGQELLVNAKVMMHNGLITFLPGEEHSINNIQCNINEVVNYCRNPHIRRECELLQQSYKPNKIKEAPISLKIILKDEIPVVARPRRLAMKERQEVNKQIEEWLENGVIQPSYSEYASALVLVKKKDKSTRICIDYRKINEKMVKDEFPLPIIDDQIDRLVNARVFSTLDLKNGFFHLKVDDDSVKYTAFVTEDGQYEFLKAPFGLSNCPKYFTRFVTMIYRELIRQDKVMIFMDDLIIPGKDEEEAMSRLKEVLQLASEYGLEMNWKKCQLMCTRLEYLGHVIENGMVRPSADKTKAVMNFPEPTTIKQLQSFIGLASYFRKFIRDFSLIAKPLTDLLKKNQIFEFGQEQRLAFESLKVKLSSEPILKIYNPDLETQLHTDASINGYAAILMQKDGGDEHFHPVYYMSRKTTDPEKKYSSYELEALAIIEGVKKFRKYLFGIKFKIVTDCSAFEKTLKKKDLCTKVARWVMLLQDYDYEVEHRAGEKMRHTDSLSRNPVMILTHTHELHHKIKEAQKLDEGLQAVVQVLQKGNFKDYYMENGLIFKGERKLVVPKGFETEIIRITHNKGHFATGKTLELVEQDYYIKDCRSKVNKYIQNCVPCILATRKEGKQEGFLQTIPKEGQPLHTIHADHIGPLAETKKKYNYILTMIDAFTKFVWLFPVKTVTAKETVEKMFIFQQAFGNPIRLITDRGSAFTSAEFREYCSEEKIEHVLITTGVPRGNGQVERVHRTLISVLTKLNVEDPTHWYKHVSRVQRALNSTQHRSIKTTPFELMVGVKMRQKEDLRILELLQEENVSAFMQERDERRVLAMEQIKKIQEENCRNYNKKRKASNKYKIGDLVAIKRTQYGNAMKLKAKFLGPYKVTAVNRNDRYRVQKLIDSTEGPKNTCTVADFMKPWYDGVDSD